MNSLFEKLGAYQFLNNILPGAVFICCAKILFDITLPTEGFGETLVGYYITGFIISRISSIIVGPICHKVGILDHVDYKDFIEAELKDSKVRTLSDINNSFQSLFTCFLLLPIAKLYQYLTKTLPWFASNLKWFVLVALILLLGKAYQKQNEYVCKRVRFVNNE